MAKKTFVIVTHDDHGAPSGTFELRGCDGALEALAKLKEVARDAWNDPERSDMRRFRTFTVAELLRFTPFLMSRGILGRHGLELVDWDIFRSGAGAKVGVADLFLPESKLLYDPAQDGLACSLEPAAARA